MDVGRIWRGKLKHKIVDDLGDTFLSQSLNAASYAN